MELFNGIDAQQAQLGDVPADLKQATKQGSDNQLLWQYTKLGCVNGIPVDQSDRNLLFESDQSLLQALEVKPTIKTWAGWLSPQHSQAVEQYRNIKQQQADGRMRIITQDKQYSTQKDAFLVILVYSQNKLKLSPRYDFYKQDTN